MQRISAVLIVGRLAKDRSDRSDRSAVPAAVQVPALELRSIKNHRMQCRNAWFVEIHRNIHCIILWKIWMSQWMYICIWHIFIAWEATLLGSLPRCPGAAASPVPAPWSTSTMRLAIRCFCVFKDMNWQGRWWRCDKRIQHVGSAGGFARLGTMSTVTTCAEYLQPFVVLAIMVLILRCFSI